MMKHWLRMDTATNMVCTHKTGQARPDLETGQVGVSLYPTRLAGSNVQLNLHRSTRSLHFFGEQRTKVESGQCFFHSQAHAIPIAVHIFDRLAQMSNSICIDLHVAYIFWGEQRTKVESGQCFFHSQAHAIPMAVHIFACDDDSLWKMPRSISPVKMCSLHNFLVICIRLHIL